MNINKSKKNFLNIYVLIGIVLLLIGCSTSPEDLKGVQNIDRDPQINPDYKDITIPPNIAPLNFSILEEGEEFFVAIKSEKGEVIKIQNSTGNIKIPLGRWMKLLNENAGNDLIIEIYAKTSEGKWVRFNSIVNHIAKEKIDKYVVYRQIGPLFNLYVKMSLVQRDLQNFDRITILDNKLTKNNCINCHNFAQGKTDRWLFHMRGELGNSMMLIVNGKIKKINTKTEFNGPVAYPAWHPSGELVAFSFSSLVLFFHFTDECRDVLDKHSGIVLYDINSNTLMTVPEISSPDNIEIWPAWSPDGTYLYFCSAPKFESFINLKNAEGLDYDKIMYSLMRVKYDHSNRAWGKPEMVIPSSKIGLSITEPRISQDGRFLLFTAAKYSQFPAYIPSADIYLLDLKNGKWKKLDINSDEVDSFHSWSSNSRWIVFSSKRDDGLFTKLYFTHIDSLGNTSKPFVLPQEDPLFYNKYLNVFNVPEFTQELVKVDPQTLADIAWEKENIISARLDENIVTKK